MTVDKSKPVLKAKHPSGVNVGRLTWAIKANKIQLPNKKFYYPETIERVGNDDVYNIHLQGGYVISNVDVRHIDLPSTRFLDLLLGGGVVRCNKDFNNNVHEDFLHDFKNTSVLKEKLDREKQVNDELRRSHKHPVDSPTSEKREKDKAEHFGDLKKKVTYGSPRQRNRGSSRIRGDDMWDLDEDELRRRTRR